MYIGFQLTCVALSVHLVVAHPMKQQARQDSDDSLISSYIVGAFDGADAQHLPGATATAQPNSSLFSDGSEYATQPDATASFEENSDDYTGGADADTEDAAAVSEYTDSYTDSYTDDTIDTEAAAYDNGTVYPEGATADETDPDSNSTLDGSDNTSPDSSTSSGSTAVAEAGDSTASDSPDSSPPDGSTTLDPPDSTQPDGAASSGSSADPDAGHNTAPSGIDPDSGHNAGAGGSGTGSGQYTFYQGDGSTGAGWPDQSAWIGDFDTMFNLNSAEMSVSCASKGVDNNSPGEISAIHDAIQSVSQSSGVDARFILAVVMQESGGCVRVPSTVSPPPDNVPNPGLMQDHNGSGTCNPGTPIEPCPSDTITLMISEGTTGQYGLSGTLQAAPAGTGAAQGYYQAARLYNSGLNSGLSDLGAPGATPCYSSDIANRLTGWTDLDSPSGCSL